MNLVDQKHPFSNGLQVNLKKKFGWGGGYNFL